MSTSIEWTDVTWNPVTGCTKVSPGCKNCYAEGIADRFFAKQYPPNPDGSPRKFTDVRCHEDRLEEPLHWKKPRRVFVNSMSDLFHEDVPDSFLLRVYSVMHEAATERGHIFQILTKRPERMRNFLSDLHARNPECPHEKMWWGVSVENQKQADARIPLLLQTPAAVRFLSVEPQLSPITLEPYIAKVYANDKPQLHWVICGGESGTGARPFNLAWAESLLEQCRAASVPFFMKQVGTAPVMHEPKWTEQYDPINLGWKEQDGSRFWQSARNGPIAPSGTVAIALNDRKGGDPSEWPAHLRVREFPRAGATMAPCEPSSTAG